MRRALFAGILPAVTALAALAPAAPALAREPVKITPFTLPANRCEFPVKVGVVSNQEYQEVTTLADGTTVTRIKGKLVESFTNDFTRKTIVRDVSGPTTTTVHPDGTGMEVGTGNSWWGFGPISQGNTGEPGLVFTDGRVVINFAGGFATGFALSGKQVNGCALLAG